MGLAQVQLSMFGKVWRAPANYISIDPSTMLELPGMTEALHKHQHEPQHATTMTPLVFRFMISRWNQPASLRRVAAAIHNLGGPWDLSKP